MKEKIKNFLKKNSFFYSIYRIVGSFFINVIKIFVKTDNKLILFVSYGGRYFNDSPKCIYDRMKNDNRFSEYKLVWAFINPKEFKNVDSVKIDSFAYYVLALKARAWITNVIVERGLKFKGKNTFYYHTTHTTLPKLMGNDIINKKVFGSNYKYFYDESCAQSDYERQLQTSMFGIEIEKINNFGYPKNDSLLETFDEEKIKSELGIKKHKKVVLYAPTYRENNPSSMVSLVNFDKWKSVLGEEFVILFRAHPTVVNMTDLSKYKDFMIDVSTYQDNTELMKISDVLVSDYSGIFFEYAILDKPMFCFAYDYEEYEKSRGLYFDIRKELSGGMLLEDEFLKNLKNFDSEENRIIARNFKNKYVTYYGNATEKSVDEIFKRIN